MNVTAVDIYTHVHENSYADVSIYFTNVVIILLKLRGSWNIKKIIIHDVSF